jgi:hypothetical protein
MTTLDAREIIQNIDSHLTAHPHATLQAVAEKLGIAAQTIEAVLREMESASFREFQENKRLAQAFKLLGASEAGASGSWENKRARPRIIIPRTTVKYRIRSFWIHKRSFSNPCPIVDLNSGGLAFLADLAPKIGMCVSLLLKFPGEEDALRLEGHVAYAVATGIAGYRNRVGIKFLPFSERRGFNTLKALDILLKFENDLALRK